MNKSTHRVEVIKVKKQPCPNADSLSLVQVGGYQVVVRTADWPDGSLGAYVVPDSLVDTTRPEFAFLATGKDIFHRVKAKRLRGNWSEGLLVPAPPGAQLGEDVAEQLGVKRYEPPEPTGLSLTFAEQETGPKQWVPVYDLESWQRYGHVFVEGEPVLITEQIHGTNCRVLWSEDRLWVGSRNQWKKEFPDYSHVTREKLQSNGVEESRIEEILIKLATKPKRENLWWKTIRQYPQIEQMLQEHPGMVLYGEVYGQVQDLTYGAAKEETRFAAFDVFYQGNFLSRDDFLNLMTQYMIPTVPHLAIEKYSTDLIHSYIDGYSYASTKQQIREGIVIRPLQERWHPDCGRVVLKAVSKLYLERA